MHNEQNLTCSACNDMVEDGVGEDDVIDFVEEVAGNGDAMANTLTTITMASALTTTVPVNKLWNLHHIDHHNKCTKDIVLASR